MDRLDGRPDLRKHVWIIAGIVGLPAEDQIGCSVDEQRVTPILADDAREFCCCGGNGEAECKKRTPKGNEAIPFSSFRIGCPD